MVKRMGSAAAAVAVAVLAVGSVAPAAGNGGGHDGHGHGHGHATVRVLSVNTEESFVDVGEPDFSLGDAFVFTSDLSRHGDPVGHTGVVCTVTSVAREESQCVGTASLPGGEITIQGLLAGEPEVFSFPITGGSGRYEGAEGTLEVRELSDTEELLTFHLSD
jgi:hypothetical protein